jgi:DNA-binding IclR family transcriptional regulator
MWNMSSLESALSVLECFSEASPELAVSDVAKRLDLPKSSVSRLLKTMAERGLVDQDDTTKRYRVGVLPFRLAQLYKAHVQVLGLVEGALPAPVAATGFSGYIGVLSGTDIVILRRLPGRYPVQMILEPGHRMPAFAAAFGKALLARLSNEELSRRLPRELVNEHAGLRRSRDDLLGELAAIRQQNYAEALNQNYLGIGAVGAAIGSADDQQPVGFSLSFPLAAVDQTHLTDIRRQVLATGTAIAEKAGDPYWQRPGRGRDRSEGSQRRRIAS